MNPQPKPRPKVLDRREAQREAERNKREVYKQVDARDQGWCRCCWKDANPRALSMLKRGHRHHLKFRSKGGQDTTANLVLLCAECHAEVHAHTLVIVGEDANGPLRFERQT